jgi:hypothetical protein
MNALYERAPEGTGANQRHYIHIGETATRNAIAALPSMARPLALPAGDTAVPAGALTLDDLRRDVNRAATAADAETLRRMLAAGA